MTESAENTKVEVKVGRWLSDGTFLGNLVRFRGEEVGGYTDYAEARSQDDRGTTYTLYRRPMPPSDEAGFRVHVERWNRWPGEEAEAWLEPTDPASQAATPFTEAEARNAFPELFAAVGRPNVRDLG